MYNIYTIIYYIGNVSVIVLEQITFKIMNTCNYYHLLIMTKKRKMMRIPLEVMVSAIISIDYTLFNLADQHLLSHENEQLI